MRRCCFIVAVVVVATCNAPPSPLTPSTPDGSVAPSLGQIVVLGDSLAVSPSRADNFVIELQKRLDAASLAWTMRNEGVSGDTTAGGLRRLDTALASDTRILIVELGANDGLRGRDIATIEQDLSAIIERAQSRAIRVLLCGMETPPTHGLTYSLEFHRLFPRLAAKYGLPLVPFLLTDVVLNPELNGDDGIHPNSAGARQIAETVWPYLEPFALQPYTVSAALSAYVGSTGG